MVEGLHGDDAHTRNNGEFGDEYGSDDTVVLRDGLEDDATVSRELRTVCFDGVDDDAVRIFEYEHCSFLTFSPSDLLIPQAYRREQVVST